MKQMWLFLNVLHVTMQSLNKILKSTRLFVTLGKCFSTQNTPLCSALSPTTPPYNRQSCVHVPTKHRHERIVQSHSFDHPPTNKQCTTRIRY